MATLFPTLERENTQEKFEQDSSLKAYGKLSGRDESAVLTEDEKALRFNSRISDNYQKLINPEYKREESANVSAEVYDSQVFEPVFEHQRVTGDVFRADSVYNAPKRSFAEIPVNSASVYTEPVYAPETIEEPFVSVAENGEIAETDLMPTATTIQYQNNLYKEEQQEHVESKKYSMTAKGKVLMLVYSLVVMVILALIIVNTSVLKTLDSDVAQQREALNAAMSEYAKVQEQVDELTSVESIIDRATNDLGMVMGD